MSVRFDAANDRISFTASAPPNPSTAFSVGGWVWISNDRNDFSTICRVHSSTGGSTCVVLGFNSDGTTPWFFSASGSVVGSSCTVGTWYYIGACISGTSAALYVCQLGGSSTFTTGTVTPGATPTGLTFGGRSAGDSSEWFDGRLVYQRMWSAKLTQAEFDAERQSTTPVKTASLFEDWPLTVFTDLTGHTNGHNLVAGTTSTTTEADPVLGSTAPDTLSGVRVGALADRAAGTLVLNDLLGSTRIDSPADGAAVGVAASDTLGAVRTGALADASAVGVTAPDVPGAVRGGIGQPDSAAVGVIAADTPGAARVGALPDSAAAGLALADQTGHTRVAGLADTVAQDVTLADVVGSVRVTGLADTVFTGQQVADTLGFVRVGALTDQPRGDLILIDVIGQVRVGALSDTAAADLVLADRPAAAYVRALLDTGTAPGLTLADVLGSVRIVGLRDVAAGALVPGSRDITVTARVLPSRYSARVLTSRWRTKEV